MNRQRQGEKEKGEASRAKAKPVKYDACRDVGNDAERVFHQLGSRSLIGRGGAGGIEKKRMELL